MIDKGGHDADYKGAGGGENAAAGGDSDEAAEQRVACVADFVNVGAAEPGG